MNATIYHYPIPARSRAVLLTVAALACVIAMVLGGCVNAEVAKTATAAREAFEAFEKFSRPRTLDKAAINEYERLAANVRAALYDHETSAEKAAK